MKMETSGTNWALWIMAVAASVAAAAFTLVCAYALLILWKIGRLLGEGKRMMAGAGTMLSRGLFARGPGAPLEARPVRRGPARILSAIAAAAAILGRMIPRFLGRRR
jgi:hypothetical protein